MSNQKKRSWPLALFFLVTGLGLMVSIITGRSLLWTLVFFVFFASMGGVVVYKRLDFSGRKTLQTRIIIGLSGGFLGTIAYDLSRYFIYLFFPLSIWPFEAIPLFGRLLAGDSFSQSWILGFGILYHLTNGIAFGIAYSILFAPRGWIAGVSWALVLEALMLSIYPGWLGVQFFAEFATISVTGHLAYGFVLGTFCRWDFLKRMRR